MSRVTRSRARSETPQTVVTDFFKTTRKPRSRGEKKLIEGTVPLERRIEAKLVTVKEEQETPASFDNAPIAPVFKKKESRTRERTPTRQAELSTPEVTGTPPKKSREVTAQGEEAPCLPIDAQDIVLENATVEKSALDELMEASGPRKKKTGIRTVADLQARLAAKGAAKAIHAQNSKNKAKVVEEHAEMLKSPKKKIVESSLSPSKSKSARALFTPKKSVPDYVVPGFNMQKSAEKIREEQDDAHEEEGKRMTAEYLKVSKLTEEVKESARQRIELPSTYAHLADSFKRVDQIASIFMGQNRTCLASELFKSVRTTSGKDFSDEHLSQILHVYPESYHVEMREQRRAFGQGGKYELEVRPNLVDDLRGYVVEKAQSLDDDDVPLVCPSKLLSPKKSPRKKVQPVPRKPEIDARVRLDCQICTTCKDYILCFVLKNTVQFCQKSSFLSRRFRKKQIDLEEVSLPSSVQRIISDLKSPKKATTSGDVPLSPKKFSEMQKEQKSKGSMSLLERIRAKEAIKKAADACVDKDLERRKQRLTLLKERYVRIVCNHYTAKRAQTMEMETIAKFVQFSSSNPTTIPDITDHLKLMCEVAPMYITEATFMNKKYLRFNDNNIEAISEILVEELDKTQQKIDAQRNNQVSQMSHTPRPKAARALKFA
ncbi:Protein CBR-CDT-1 [Caenorhabditis briggsae]|uniref:Protein CBR-CDT-1 n=1 Tax=Caenorhabditis briggsae TaxID=6238 RepID=A8XL50_CAEBR|nr:Protein CBR-CDT-1 [Caenorhabditis briggsae]CAP33375.2 Protein CBR-CDT-1 [Caenorhabditis briggsae]